MRIDLGRWGVLVGAVATAMGGMAAAPSASWAQAEEPWRVADEVFAGSDLEEYLRVLQAGGAAAWHPWGVRALSAREVGRMVDPGAAHPWAGRYDFSLGEGAGVEAGWIRPRVAAIVNTAYPSGGNDGAVWAGRGLTSVLEGGAWARVGPLSLTVAPVLFRAENMEFELLPSGRSGRLAYAEGRSGGSGIDLPQRFGAGAYTRLSPGQSTLRLDAGPVAAALSTANQYWGPATSNPMILGNNAEGFPHLFVGTSRPLNIGIGRAHGRMVWGVLEASEFSPEADPDAQRFMSGFVGSFHPRGLSGLEVGATRFFHSPWPEGGPGVDELLKPLEGFLKAGLAGDGDDGSDDDNQLASVFVRWLVPDTGFEVYGEYAREDHNWDARDFFLEPDHNSAYMLGMRRVWGGERESWTVVRAEVMNAEISHLSRVRDQTRFYRHSRMQEGHTVNGQILGAPDGFGGAAAELAVDRYERWGRWTAGWKRAVYDRGGRYWFTGVVQEEAVDTSHGLTGEVVWFRGPLEVEGTLEGVYRFNRYFGDDAVNVHAALGVVWRP